MIDSNDGFRDLAPLRPRSDGARWEAMVAGVERAAAPELARRATASAGLIGLLSNWTRPAVPAALAVGTAALALAAFAGGMAEPETPGVSDALGFPDPVAAWVEANETPTLEEMVLSLEGGTR